MEEPPPNTYPSSRSASSSCTTQMQRRQADRSNREGELPQLVLRIREARPDDARGVVHLLNSLIAGGAPIAFDGPFAETEERAYIATFPERGVFLVALASDDALVGFQSLEPFAAYTHVFDHVGVIGTYVDAAHQRRGVATQLFAATREAAKSKGYEKIFTYIREDNLGALATYQAHGFRIVGRADQHGKVNGQYVNVIIVERRL